MHPLNHILHIFLNICTSLIEDVNQNAIDKSKMTGPTKTMVSYYPLPLLNNIYHLNFRVS